MTIDIGIQSFEKICARNSFYVDKTDFIKEWWEKDVYKRQVQGSRSQHNPALCQLIDILHNRISM